MAAPKLDLPDVQAAKPAGRYVTVPDTDLFDQPHPAIRVNTNSYGPGTHFLAMELANTVEDRLKAYVKSNVRILQPKRDMESENLVALGRGSATTQF